MTRVYAVSPIDMHNGLIEAGKLYEVELDGPQLFTLKDVEIIGLWSGCNHLMYHGCYDKDWERVEVEDE